MTAVPAVPLPACRLCEVRPPPPPSPLPRAYPDSFRVLFPPYLVV